MMECIELTKYIWNGVDHTGQTRQGIIASESIAAASKSLNQQNITVFAIEPQHKRHKQYRDKQERYEQERYKQEQDKHQHKQDNRNYSENRASNALTTETINGTEKTSDNGSAKKYNIRNIVKNAKKHSNQKIKPEHLAVFMQQLAFLINTNVPLVISLETIAKDNVHHGMRQLVQHIKSDIESGSTLTAALCKYPQHFLTLWCNLINTGEKTGTLDTMLRYIAEHIAKGIKQKHKLIKALLYPLVVLGVGIIVSAVLLAFVIPQFQEMFANFGATLPAYTQLIISAANFLKACGLYLIGALSGASVSVYVARQRSPKFAHRLDDVALRLPFYGAILHKVIIGNYARILHITVKAGFPLLDALSITATNINNWRYQQSISNMQKEITNGCTLHSAMRKQNLFAERVLQMVMLGEESGNLDEMLEAVANSYAEEVDYTIDNLNNLLEPLLMLILGVVVGGLIVGMYLPIFRLGNVI